MLRRNQIKPVEAPFSDDAAAILLHGWVAEPPLGRQGQGFIGIGFLFEASTELEDLWREHEAHLRAVARAWGWTPSHWVMPTNEYGLRFVMDEQGENNEGPYYFAEALAVAGPQRIGG